MNIFLKHLSFKIPRRCVVALINEESKKAFVFVTKNARIRIQEIINEIESNSFNIKEVCQDYDKLTLSILETHTDYSFLQLAATYHQNKLRERGYTLYKYTKYKSYYYGITFTYDYSGNLKVAVEQRTNSRSKQVIGLFNTLDEAESFIQYIPKNSLGITCYNDNTRNYMNEYNEDLNNVFKIRF